MLRRWFFAGLLVAVSTTAVNADLRYTLRTEARPSTAPSSTPPNPLFTMLSTIVLGMIAPPGGTEIVVTVGDRATRVDYARAFAIIPAGGAVLVTDTGTVVLNPAAKTYWKMPKMEAMPGMGTPTLSVKRTGKFATVAGIRAEHAIIEIKMPLPAAGATLPGLPPELNMSGEAWFSDAHKKYARPSGALGGFAGSIGLGALDTAGFLMRSVLRSELFGQQELETVVTDLREGAVAPSTFEIPTGFTEVPPPSMGGMMPPPAPR
jgi:hypothetical protein